MGCEREKDQEKGEKAWESLTVLNKLPFKFLMPDGKYPLHGLWKKLLKPPLSSKILLVLIQ